MPFTIGQQVVVDSTVLTRVGRVSLEGIEFYSDPRTYKPFEMTKRYRKAQTVGLGSVRQDFGMTILDASIQLISDGSQDNEQHPLDADATARFFNMASDKGKLYTFKDWLGNEFTVTIANFTAAPLMGVPDKFYYGYTMSLDVVAVTSYFNTLVSFHDNVTPPIIIVPPAPGPFHHFTFTHLGSFDHSNVWDPLVYGVTMPVTIEARDINENVITTYANPGGSNVLTVRLHNLNNDDPNYAQFSDGTVNQTLSLTWVSGVASFTVEINVGLGAYAGQTLASNLTLQIASNYFTNIDNVSSPFAWGHQAGAPFGWFKMELPYTWNASNGPVPVFIGAMIDDGTSYLFFTGTVVVALASPVEGTLDALYDEDMNLLPTLETTVFTAGTRWRGYAAITVAANPIGLSCFDSVSSVGGNSNPCTIIV